MSEWICVKCGETATSKCPHQRSVFPTNQHATIIGNDMDIQTIYDGHGTELFINVRQYPDPDLTRQEVFMRWLKNLASDEKTLESAMCHHSWIMNSETKEVCRMGCKHPNLSTYEPPEPVVEEPKSVTPHAVAKHFFQYACYVMRDAMMPVRGACGRDNQDLMYEMECQLGNMISVINRESDKFLNGNVPIGPVFEVIYQDGDEKERVPFDREHHAILFGEALCKQGIDSKIYRYTLDRKMVLHCAFEVPPPTPGFYIIVRNKPGNDATEQRYKKRYDTLDEALCVGKSRVRASMRYMCIIVDENDNPVDGWEDHDWNYHDQQVERKARKLARHIKEV